MVYRFVARRLPAGPDDASDLVQEVFLRLWREDQPPETEQLRSYLLTVANRLVIDRYRRKATRDRHAAVVAQAPVPSVAPVEHFDVEPAVREAIAELPDHLRETFELSRVDGLTYREIAELQNVSVKAIEARMTKALHRLREALAPFLTVLVAGSLPLLSMLHSIWRSGS